MSDAVTDALRSIAEGNLGDGPGQANYARIKQVAQAALAAPAAEPVITDELRGQIAYQLTRRLVIDMPTARACVDDALKGFVPAAPLPAQGAGHCVIGLVRFK